MASTVEQVTQAVREWLKAAGASGGLTDAQVIIPEGDNTRPPLPYLTVKRLSDAGVAEPSDVYSTSGGDPTVYFTQDRAATYSVQGYGRTTEEWLERVDAIKRDPTIQALLLSSGITVRPGPVVDISDIVASGWETRYSMDVAVDYRRSSATDTATEVGLGEVSVDYTQNSHLPISETDPDELQQTVTITV